MAKAITILKGTTGINNKADPVRLQDKEGYISELALGVNIDIHQYRPGRRKGYAATSATSDSHSLFCAGGDCLFISGTALYRLNADYTATGIRSGLTSGLRMYYVQVGEDIYYMNGSEMGRYNNGTSYTWSAGTNTGLTTTRTFSTPPCGTHIEHFAGRLWIADKDSPVVWYTEPFSYSWVDLARDFIPFGQNNSTKIRMIRSVADGLYISTDREIYHLLGRDPIEGFEVKKVADYPAIENTDVVLNGTEINPELGGHVVVMFTATEGICAGLPQGQFINFTERKLTYPSSSKGTGGYVDGKYIALLEP